MQAVKASVQGLHQQLLATSEQSSTQECSLPGIAMHQALHAVANAAWAQQLLETSPYYQLQAGPGATADQQQQQQVADSALSAVAAVQVDPPAATQQVQMPVDKEDIEGPSRRDTTESNAAPGLLGDPLVVVQIGNAVIEAVDVNAIREGGPETSSQQAEERPETKVQAERGASTVAVSIEETSMMDVSLEAGPGSCSSNKASQSVTAACCEDAFVHSSALAEAGDGGASAIEQVGEPSQAQVEDSCYMKAELGAELSEDAATERLHASDPWAAAELEAAVLPPGVVPAASIKMAAIALKNRQTGAQQPVTADHYFAMEFAAAAAFDPKLVALELRAQVSDDGRRNKSCMLSMRSSEGLFSSGIGQIPRIGCNEGARALPSLGGTPRRNTPRNGSQSMRTPRSNRG
jgi:hypothetical protein